MISIVIKQKIFFFIIKVLLNKLFNLHLSFFNIILFKFSFNNIFFEFFFFIFKYKLGKFFFIFINNGISLLFLFFWKILIFFKSNTLGIKNSLKIKGFGRRCRRTKNLFKFQLGQSFRIFKTISKDIMNYITKKKTRLRFFSTNFNLFSVFLKSLIKLKPTFKYKDTGIRFSKKKPFLKKRRISAN